MSFYICSAVGESSRTTFGYGNHPQRVVVRCSVWYVTALVTTSRRINCIGHTQTARCVSVEGVSISLVRLPIDGGGEHVERERAEGMCGIMSSRTQPINA